MARTSGLKKRTIKHSKSRLRSPVSRVVYVLKKFWPFTMVVGSAIILTALLFSLQYPQTVSVEASNKPLLLKFEQSFAADWFHVNREGIYDYAPNGMIEGNTWRIWSCGGQLDGNGNAMQGDWIFYTSLLNGSHQGTRLVLSPSTNLQSMDSRYACAPAVVINTNSYIKQIMGSEKVYMMHYECSPNAINAPEAFTEICVAYSTDGMNWKKFNRATWDQSNQFVDQNGVASSVIQASSAVRQRCGYEFKDGRHVLNVPECMNRMDSYGSGHPSTILGPHDQIWLWYYDSGNDWNDRGVRLVKSWDGFNFSAPIKTNMQSPAEVTRLTINNKVYFVATTVLKGKNVYVTSLDGISWTHINASGILKWTGLGLGAAVYTDCAAPSQAAVLTDARGNVSGPYVNLLSAEGRLGPRDLEAKPKQDRCYSALEDPSMGGSRGSTWGIRLIQGNFRPVF